MPPQIPTNYHRWDPNIFARDLQVADSLRVVVDAMRLQSGKKDEKPEKARKNMCFGTSMLWTMGWNGIWDIQKYPKMGFGPKKSRNPMVDLAGWWMCFQLYPQPIETTHLFAINDPCMESWAFLFVVTDSYWIVVDTLHILFFFNSIICQHFTRWPKTWSIGTIPAIPWLLCSNMKRINRLI